MPDRDALIRSAGAEALKHIKKIVGSRGRLQGNFYFAGDARGGAALIITLTGRDPRGLKATSQGRTLRAAMSGARFARGIVRSTGSRVIFERHTGNATAAHMRRGFKDAFSDRSLASLKTLLRRALVLKPGEDTPAPEAAAPEEAALLALSADERAELEALVAAQGPLLALNDSLMASFLSASEAQAELEEILSLAADRRAAHLDASLRQTAAHYTAAIATVEGQLAALRSALLASGDADLVHIATTGLGAVIGVHHPPLSRALAAWQAAPEPAALQRIGALAADFAAHVASDERVAAVDDNPLSVPVTVRERLGPVLGHLVQAAVRQPASG